MRLTRCEQGHFFDGEKYATCPHCGGVEESKSFEPSASGEQWIPPLTPPESIVSPPILPVVKKEKEVDSNWNFDEVFLSRPDPVILREDENYSSKVIGVTMYPAGTKVLRRVVFTPKEEQSTIYVTDIPEHRVDDVHIRVSKGLTCFSQASAYWVSEEEAKEVERQNKDFEDTKSKEVRERQIKELSEQCNYLVEQCKIWKRIRKDCQKRVSKQMEGINVQEVSDKLTQLLEKEFELRKDLIENVSKYEKLMQENQSVKPINELSRCSKKCLKLVLIAKPEQTYCIDIEYESNEALWTPTYEIWVESGEAQGTICLYANIKKMSSELWENVDLTMSTGITQPFDPEILGEIKPMVIAKKTTKPIMMSSMISAPSDVSGDEENSTTSLTLSERISFDTTARFEQNDDLDLESTLELPSIEIMEKTTSIRHEFRLPDRISLSENANAKILIWKQKIDLQPYYFAVPEKDSAEYMAIRLTELEKHDVIASDAKVYLDHEYTRNFFLDPDELSQQVVLGRAKGVSVKRTLRKNDIIERKLQGKTVQTYEYCISVINDRKHPVRLQVLDHFPITSDPDVVIEVKNASGAEIDSATGQCIWNVSLQAEKTCELELSYAITYPSKGTYECCK